MLMIQESTKSRESKFSWIFQLSWITPIKRKRNGYKFPNVEIGLKKKEKYSIFLSCTQFLHAKSFPNTNRRHRPSRIKYSESTSLKYSPISMAIFCSSTRIFELNIFTEMRISPQLQRRKEIRQKSGLNSIVSETIRSKRVQFFSLLHLKSK